MIVVLPPLKHHIFTMIYSDFDNFKKFKPWLIRQNTPYELFPSNLALQDEFINAFPKMARLISKGRATGVIFKEQRHLLLTWERKAGGACGWFLKIEDTSGDEDLRLSYKHTLLLHSIGGIIETYGGVNPAFTQNQNFLFLREKCQCGIGSVWDEFYHIRCQQENAIPVKHDHAIVFAIENANQYTMYDLETEQVLVFVTDPGQDFLQKIPGQPDATFYTLEGAATFTEYVETLAQQWLDWVK
jgi:hypothetical protein